MGGSELSPGALLDGRYRIERPLGRGGMGAVFLATHESMGRRVAVKVLDLNLEQYPEAAERFRREGRAAATIGHPGVVEVLDMGATSSGQPYLVMEFLEGDTLRHFAKRHAPVTAGVASAVLVPMLETLAAAHAAGVLHRDLKPANVMLATGASPSVKLLDFGVSKFLRSVTVITRTGTAVGTPAYMSPEQMNGAKDLDARADLYSVGVIAYELLSGRLPFQAENEVHLMRQVIFDRAPPLATVAPQVPARLCALVDSLVAREPQARPASADEARARLVSVAPPQTAKLWELVKSPPPDPPRAAVGERATPSGSEPQLASGDILAASTAPMAALTLPQAPARRRRVGVLAAVAVGLAVAGGAAGLVAGGVWSEESGPSPGRPMVRPTPPPPPFDVVPRRQPVPAGDPVDAANRAIDAGDLVTARKLLEGFQVDGALHPRAKALLAQLDQERDFPDKLDEAASLIRTGRDPGLAKAQVLLAQTDGTRLFRTRRTELLAALQATENERLERQRRREAFGDAPREAGVEVEGPSAPAGSSRALYEQATQLAKDKGTLAKAKTLLLKCIKQEPTASDCHRVLGSVYAKMGDPRNGTKHYKRFLELDPDHPKAAMVRQMVEAYETQR